MIRSDADLTRYKAIFAPLQYILSEKAAGNIRRFVENGGMFVTSFRLGVKDESNQIVRTALPGLLRDVMGVTVRDYVPIYTEKIAVNFSSELAGPDGQCLLWVDILQPTTSSVLANSYGKGKAVYVGADLDSASLARIVRTLMEIAGIKSSFGIPPGVEMTVRKSSDKQWVFLLNHTPSSQQFSLPGRFHKVLTGATQSGSGSLKPYGVMVLQPA